MSKVQALFGERPMRKLVLGQERLVDGGKKLKAAKTINSQRLEDA